MNKKKVIIGSTAVAGIALVGGAFALFSDFAEQDVTGTVGSVDVSAKADISHTQLKRDEMAKIEAGVAGDLTYADLKNAFEAAPDNLNPGDNTPTKPNNTDEDDDNVEEKGPRPGTDHEISITVNNEGTKSVRTRVLVTLSGTKDGQALTAEQLKNISVYLDKYNTISGITGVAVEGVDDYAVSLDSEVSDDRNSIIYLFTGDDAKQVVDKSESEIKDIVTAPSEILKAGMILSGTGKNAEIEKYVYGDETAECPTTGTFKLDITCASDEAQAELQGAELTFNVKVEAAQYRNTDNTVWETLFDEDFSVQG